MKALFTTLLVTMMSFAILAQNKTEKHPTLISIRPVQFTFGLNTAIETPLSSKFSLKTEVNYHFYTPYKNIAISPTLKWYFINKVGNGLHLNLKTFGGYFFKQAPMINKPYFIGYSGGIGWISPQYKDYKWRFFVEINVKQPYSFGNRTNSPNSEEDGAYEMLYLYYLSPVSILELNWGFAFRL